MNNSTASVNSSCSVNAWIFLNEDQPTNANYNSSNSSYQRLIQNNIYQSVDILFICFMGTTMVSNDTVPTGNDTSYTIKINPASHPGGLTNQDYMNNVISDARKNNPNIKIAVTLDWGNGNMISNIFTNSTYSPQETATHFAANLMTYLKKYDLDGFDIDWDGPISLNTSKEQFILLVNAIGTEFKQQTNKHYYFTLSPGETGNLDTEAVNSNIDFVNLQLYLGSTNPDGLKNAGVNSNLFAYGAKFESTYQTAAQAYQDNGDHYHCKIFTCWRLNSDNYIFEQTQQQQLHGLCNGSHV